TRKEESSTANKTASFDDSFPAKFSFAYPSNWTMSEEHDGTLPVKSGEPATQTITITSLSGKYSVSYRVGINGGLGGNCQEEYVGKYVKFTREEITKFSGASFVESTETD